MTLLLRIWSELNLVASMQDLPYTASERSKSIKLGVEIAEDEKRPRIREAWNPALGLLLTLCWAHNATLRPSLRRIASMLSAIMSSNDALITSGKRSATAAVENLKVTGEFDFTPGALWRRIQIHPEQIELGPVLGSGSYSMVHSCRFGNKAAACKIFRNCAKEKAYKEIEITFAMRHPNVIGIYAWFQIQGKFDL